MFTDYCLKCGSQEEFEALLTAEGWPGVNIDVIGTIYRPTEATDENGTPIMESTEGWHVNVRTTNALPSSLEPFVIEKPLHPKRVWLGDA